MINFHNKLSAELIYTHRSAFYMKYTVEDSRVKMLFEKRTETFYFSLNILVFLNKKKDIYFLYSCYSFLVIVSLFMVLVVRFNAPTPQLFHIKFSLFR